jgi:membrane-bound metal-dependent hydrolase YbcI (DUF457 family)
MFVGHLAVALSAKRVEPRVSLGAWIAAAFGLDLLWPFFLLAGLERVRIDPGNTAFTPLAFDHYPWSHSLLMAVVWGALASALVVTRHRIGRAGILVGLAVVSHWVLDWVTHRADLPLWPSGPKVGLGLWNSIPATLLVEGMLFVAAIAIYTNAFRARDRIGRWAFWALIVVTAAVWASGPWSPPPPSARAIAVVGVTMGVFALWGSWIDRHRIPRL